MAATRSSLSDTVHELRGRVSESMDWRTYFERYTGLSLVGAAVVGMVVGRVVGMRVRVADGAPVAPAYATALPERVSERSGGLVRMRDSWARAGARIEGIVNRFVDEVADLVEHGALPAVMQRIRAAAHLDQPGSGSSDFTFHPTNR